MGNETYKPVTFQSGFQECLCQLYQIHVREGYLKRPWPTFFYTHCLVAPFCLNSNIKTVVKGKQINRLT